MEFAVRVPEAYRLREDGAPFTFIARNGVTGDVVEEVLVLVSRPVADSAFLIAPLSTSSPWICRRVIQGSVPL